VGMAFKDLLLFWAATPGKSNSYWMPGDSPGQVFRWPPRMTPHALCLQVVKGLSFSML
jgi:hypothetical protein